jgi:hypothetical protein
MRKLRGITLCLASALLSGGTAAQAQESYLGWLLTLNRQKEIQPVSNEAYQHECGECHFAYQPGLLPARSWDALLEPQALRDHFGVNAELDAATRGRLHDYAVANAADRSYSKRSRKIAVATAAGPVPMRISRLEPVARVHRRIDLALITGNPEVKSLAACDKCHTEAAQGVYESDTVRIPGATRPAR